MAARIDKIVISELGCDFFERRGEKRISLLVKRKVTIVTLSRRT